MRIAHVSDIHIRNFKYRDEYGAAFEDLYRQLEDLQPDLVINTGDTVHSKLAVSPELFDDVAAHMLSVSDIAPYWLILGNHDLNLKNKARTDAISPIVRALQGRTKHQLSLMGHGGFRLKGFHDFHFIHYDIRRGGVSDWHFELKQQDVNIGLYHGSVSGCVTDQGFVMENGEVSLDSFKGLDFAMLGDIHKRQSFRDGRVQYPGSLIQQNYGEELVKGFLLWDIQDKATFTTSFHPVRAPHRFYTIQVPANLDLPSEPIPRGSRVRAMVEGELSPSQRLELERKLRDAYAPCEVITPDSSGEQMQMKAVDVDSLVGSRDQLMRDHLSERGVIDPEDVIRLFHGYEQGLESDSSARGTTWKLKRLEWDNMLNYGEGNVLDLTKMSGLVGIFAPNASGKSSIFDIMLEGLFDRVSKEVPRNIDLVNDNKDLGQIRVWFDSADREFMIDRRIERIQYGQRKLAETKQWGRTSLDFTGGDESLNGNTRPETEKAVRQVIGSFEDFALTSMITQNPVFGLPGGADLLNCKETDRRKILFRMLDLDVYEKVGALVREDLKQLMGKLKLDRDKLVARIDELQQQHDLYESSLRDAKSKVESIELELGQVRANLTGLGDAEQTGELLVRTREQYDSAALTLRLARETAAVEVQALADVTLRITECEGARPTAPTTDLRALNSRIKTLRSIVEEQKLDLSRSKSAHSSGLKTLKSLENIPCGSQFPTCRFIVDAIEFSSQRDTLKQAIDDLEASVATAVSDLTDNERELTGHAALQRWNETLSKLRLALVRAEKNSAEADLFWNTAQQDEGELAAKLDQLAEQAKALDTDAVKLVRAKERRLDRQLSGSRTVVEDLLRKLGATQAACEQAEASLAEYDALKDSARGLEALAEMCGKNGLPYRILSLVLPLINSEISKILSGIVKFNVFFEDDADEQTVSLYIRYGDYKSRPLSLGSGAEKFIASLAIRVALLSVTSLPKTDILVIDEGFGRLDPEHLEALQRMFEYLREAFGTVFIVSHVDFMRDIVDHSIEITALDAYAHVEAS